MKISWGVIIVLFFISCKSKPETITEIIDVQPQKPSRQKIEVITQHLDDTRGIMYLYDNETNSGGWQKIDSFPVVVGKNGLAYDSMQIHKKHGVLKIKHEGDGCSPAGSFALSKVFSYHDLQNLKMPFEQVDENDLCIDDVTSKHYNTLIDDDTINSKDYSSFERMKRDDLLYEYGVWVNYNTDPQRKGNGSCIFLHIWEDENSGTSGCTAMSKENMLKLINWLDHEKKPVLFQYVLIKH